MKIHELLSLFGLTENEQEIFLLLHKVTWITVLDLSKKTNIKRSTLYRILESLHKKGVIEMQVDDKTTYYKAGTTAAFKSLIIDQEKKTKQLQQGFSDLKTELSLLTTPTNLQTTVNFYRGKRSLQHMEWKICSHQNSETYIFGANKWDLNLGESFAEEARARRVEKKVSIKEILNTHNDIKIPKNGTVSWTQIPDYVQKHYLHRSIDPSILDIQTEINISSEHIYIQSYEKDEMVGIELVSPAFAKSLAQLFKLAWNQAQVIDDFGGENF